MHLYKFITKYASELNITRLTLGPQRMCVIIAESAVWRTQGIVYMFLQEGKVIYFRGIMSEGWDTSVGSYVWHAP